MSQKFFKQYGDYGALADPALGNTFAWNAGAPTNTDIGYAPGCIWLDITNAVAYINTNTAASATWVKLAYSGETIAALTVTALTYGSLNDGTTTLAATALELNRRNKVSTNVVALSTTPIAITEAAHDGKTCLITKSDGIAITLPVAAAGLKFRFIVQTTITSASTIKSVSGADIMIGHALMGNNSDNTVVSWEAIASNTYDTIDLLGTSNSTGGMAGQEMIIEGMAANLWYVYIRGDASGTEATPFADTVT